MTRDLKQAVVNCDLGRDCGDAFGVPFENMSRQEILNATGGEGLTRPRFDFDPSRRKVPDTRGLAMGSTSDDSQLGRACSRGLVMAGRYHHELQVLLSLEELWRDVAGWGGTTRLGLYEIDKWYRRNAKRLAASKPAFKKDRDRKLWEEAEPRHPEHPARWRPNARGNAPAMKVSPLGCAFGLLGGGDFESGEALDIVTLFSGMTHADPIPGTAAYAVGGVISDLLSDGPATARLRLLGRVEFIEATFAFRLQGPDRFAATLAQALALINEPEALWAFGAASKSDALGSVSLALAIWWRHADDDEPTAAVLEAINAGGDTDTVGSMVGAMMGASSGDPDWWPASWVRMLQDGGATARDLGARLHDVCSLRKLPEGFDLDEIKHRLGYL